MSSCARRLAPTLLVCLSAIANVVSAQDIVDVRSGVFVTMAPLAHYRVKVPQNATKLSVRITGTKELVQAEIAHEKYPGAPGVQGAEFTGVKDITNPAAGNWYILATHADEKHRLLVTVFTKDGEVKDMKAASERSDAVLMIPDPSVTEHVRSVAETYLSSAGHAVFRLYVPKLTARMAVRATTSKGVLRYSTYRNYVDRSVNAERCVEPAQEIVCEKRFEPGDYFIVLEGTPRARVSVRADMYPDEAVVEQSNDESPIAESTGSVAAVDLPSDPQIVGRFQKFMDFDIPAAGKRIFRLTVPSSTGGVTIDARSNKGKIRYTSYYEFLDESSIHGEQCVNRDDNLFCDKNKRTGVHYLVFEGKPGARVTLKVDMYPAQGTAEPTLLKSGVALKHQSSPAGEQRIFRITVPRKATTLTVETAAGGPDVGLYVMRGEPATPPIGTTCQSQRPRTTEQRCVIDLSRAVRSNAENEDWFITLYSPRPFSDVTLTATVRSGPSQDEAIAAALDKKTDRQIDAALKTDRQIDAALKKKDDDAAISAKLSKRASPTTITKGKCRVLQAIPNNSDQRQSFCTALQVPSHPRLPISGHYQSDDDGNQSTVTLHADGTCAIRSHTGAALPGPCRWGIRVRADGSADPTNITDIGESHGIVLEIPDQSLNRVWTFSFNLKPVPGLSGLSIGIGSLWSKFY